MTEKKGESINSQEQEQIKLVDLHSHDFEEKLKREGSVYVRKIEPIVGALQVHEPVTVETLLPDGTLESTQEAREGDWVITGSKGEKFVFTDKKFQDLYRQGDKGSWVPKERKIIAIQNFFGESVRIVAPWGTKEKPAYQDGSEKCMLVIGLDSAGNFTSDRYIIGDEEMLLNNYYPAKK